jgi:ankyrin repeat protein
MLLRVGRSASGCYNSEHQRARVSDMFGSEDQEIHDIAFEGDVQQLKSFLDKNPELIEAKGWHDRTPLHCAAGSGHVDCVRLLIERGADVNAYSQLSSATALFEAIEGENRDDSPGEPLACAQLLLENGADPNIKSSNRSETAIFHVRSLDALLLLAKYGADLDVISDENNYPFEYHAYYAGDPALLDFWLERGVDVNHNPGFTQPVLNGVVSHLVNYEGQEDKIHQIQKLLDYGADPNLGEHIFGNSPLHIAASKGRADIARILLDGGADPNSQNHEKETPLHKAVQEGQVALVKLLIERGADVNIKDVEKLTPWSLAQDSPELRSILEPFARDVPETRPTPDELIKRLFAIPSFGREVMRPCSEDEIARLEQEFDVILPESYKKFLRLMGRGAGGFLETDHWDAFYPYLLEIGQDYEYADYCYDLPERYFVFASRLGGIFLFFIADGTETEDPPVYAFGDNYDGTFKKIHDSFWGFFEEMVVYYEVYNKKGLV